MAKKKKYRYRGIEGNYVLNQKFQVFADRRTKRNKTRSEQKRRAIMSYS